MWLFTELGDTPRPYGTPLLRPGLGQVSRGDFFLLSPLLRGDTGVCMENPKTTTSFSAEEGGVIPSNGSNKIEGQFRVVCIASYSKRFHKSHWCHSAEVLRIS